MQNKVTYKNKVRRKGLLRVAATICLLSIVFLFFPSITVAPKAQEATPEVKPVENTDFVSTILPYPIDYVHDSVTAQFDSETRNYFEDYSRFIYDLPEKVLSYKDLTSDAYDRFMALPLVKPTKFYVFYGAYATMQKTLAAITPLSVIGLTNPALVRYASLTPEQREQDIYVWSPDSPYWHSEYSLKGEKLPFRSFFIIHLSAVDDAHTKVEVIEHKPVVRIQGRPSVDENGTFQDFDVEEVAPTTRDRSFLLSCVQQFIERNVPSRAKFNCRDGTEPPPMQWTTP
jgi:hypothetical protein